MGSTTAVRGGSSKLVVLSGDTYDSIARRVAGALRAHLVSGTPYDELLVQASDRGNDVSWYLCARGRNVDDVSYNVVRHIVLFDVVRVKNNRTRDVLLVVES